MTAVATNVAVSNEGFFSKFRARLAEARRVRAVERQTYEELNALTLRELDDIGISRYDIARLAREAGEAARG